jgi:exodeoxyribonuclease VII large subunit
MQTTPHAVTPAATAAEPPRKAYAVSAVLGRIREILDERVPALWVRGELSGWKRAASGHCYFTLKDHAAQLRCVLFRRDAERLPAMPREGMEVMAYGRITAYPARGELQMSVQSLDATTAGGLWQLAFDALRARLLAEGLLAQGRKRPLPQHPACIGVVTSRTGAVLHDITRVVERRAPWTHIVLSDCRVQGDGAAADIARAIECFSRRPCADLLIVGRGGGSREDLWAFNEEPVARAIAASPVPVVSAVGHETDVTIADLVADVRAPTPSAAAELVVPDAAELRRLLDAAPARMERTIRLQLGRAAQQVEDAAPLMQRTLRRGAERADRDVQRAYDRITHQMESRTSVLRQRLLGLGGHLEALSPLAALRRGYALATDDAGRLLRDAEDVGPGQAIRLQLARGRLRATVDEVEADLNLEEPDVP